MRFPEVIETERMTLRRPRRSDAGPMTLYAGDRRVALMLSSVPHPYPPGAAEAFVERSLASVAKEHVWIMDALKVDGPEFIGAISLKAKGEGVWELGYWVGPPFWNTGYASEAAVAVVAAAQAAGARLTAQVAVENEASAHVLVNAGFREAGEGEAYNVARGEMTRMRLFDMAVDEEAAGA